MKRSSKAIRKIVINYFKLKESEFDSKTRKDEIVMARQIAHYLSSENTSENLKEIGKNIGNKDHSTVTYSIKTITENISVDKCIYKYCAEIQKKIDNYYSSDIDDSEIKKIITHQIIKRFDYLLNKKTI